MPWGRDEGNTGKINQKTGAETRCKAEKTGRLKLLIYRGCVIIPPLV
jgi:hypothetical protein